MRSRAAVLIMLLALFAVLAGGCGKTAIAGKDGKMMRYGLSEIRQDGFYVHYLSDDTFTPVMNGASGYEGTSDGLDTGRCIWLGNDEYNLIDLTPQVAKGKSELVAVYAGENDLPAAVLLEGFENLGYTLGVRFSISENGKKLYLDTSGICESSEAAEKLSSYSTGLLPVEGVETADGSTVLPIGNIDRNAGLLVGLEKDMYYGLRFYDGTGYCEEDLKADTLALKMKSSVTVSEPYEETKSGYFVVKLPDNIEEGYYYINGEGMFSYTERGRKID